jgi:hypothetical protein
VSDPGRPSDLYEVLGVAPSAPTAEIRRAYLGLARRHHPDLDSGDAERMRAVNDAWATLGDPVRRARYDAAHRAPTDVAPDPGPERRSDEEDLLADLADDTPVGARVVLPPWLSLLPVAVFALSVAAFCIGVLFSAAGALAVSVVLFAVSCAMFLLAPFVALLSSRRVNR